MKNFHLQTAKRLATLLDNKFEFLGIRFGLDPILDLIPGFGDVFTAVLSLYILNVAKELKLPSDRIRKIIINIILDFILGLIPVVGNIGTIFFRSNILNIKIIEDYLGSRTVEEGVIVG